MAIPGSIPGAEAGTRVPVDIKPNSNKPLIRLMRRVRNGQKKESNQCQKLNPRGCHQIRQCIVIGGIPDRGTSDVARLLLGSALTKHRQNVCAHPLSPYRSNVGGALP